MKYRTIENSLEECSHVLIDTPYDCSRLIMQNLVLLLCLFQQVVCHR